MKNKTQKTPAKKQKSAVSKPKELKITIVKRGWHIEPYDEKKVYGSCVFACRMAHLSQREAERIAEKIAPAITRQIRKKKFTSSDDIFRLLISELSKYDQDASFMYETHRDIS